MLVLSRRRNERIVIARNIVVSIVEIRGDKVRIGIEAPLDVKVMREELLQVVKQDEPISG